MPAPPSITQDRIADLEPLDEVRQQSLVTDGALCQIPEHDNLMDTKKTREEQQDYGPPRPSDSRDDEENFDETLEQNNFLRVNDGRLDQIPEYGPLEPHISQDSSSLGVAFDSETISI